MSSGRVGRGAQRTGPGARRMGGAGVSHNAHQAARPAPAAAMSSSLPPCRQAGSQDPRNTRMTRAAQAPPSTTDCCSRMTRWPWDLRTRAGSIGRSSATVGPTWRSAEGREDGRRRRHAHAGARGPTRVAMAAHKRAHRGRARGGRPRDTRAATAPAQSMALLALCAGRALVVECFSCRLGLRSSQPEWYSSTLAMSGIPGAEYSRT